MVANQVVIFNSSRVRSLVTARLPGWDEERFGRALVEYQRFLTLCKENPGSKVMAPADVDELWHMHMLDSVHYTNDCKRIFGEYLHHDPCIGEPDIQNTRATLDLYEELFGERPGAEWKKMLTCANPGGGCGSITASHQNAH